MILSEEEIKPYLEAENISELFVRAIAQAAEEATLRKVGEWLFNKYLTSWENHVPVEKIAKNPEVFDVLIFGNEVKAFKSGKWPEG